ncbi:MAG TPA: hypothetical protein PLO62_00270 [Candidatus Hydrogenedentes bacterium]|nr:hypothetical protein [Candidatus Hydrogenedentota bacterium]
MKGHIKTISSHGQAVKLAADPGVVHAKEFGVTILTAVNNLLTRKAAASNS